MSATLSTVVRTAVSRRLRVVSRLLGVYRDRVVGCFIRRVAIKTFRERDDRALRDLGLVRVRIEAADRGLPAIPGRGRR
jgi:hypothetical protein